MSELDNQTLVDLLIKYERDELSAEENSMLQEWLLIPGNAEIFEGLIHDESLLVELKQDHFRKKRILARVKTSEKLHRPLRIAGEKGQTSRRVILIRHWRWAAAMIVLTLSVSAYFWYSHNFGIGLEGKKGLVSIANDVLPGGNKAKLILSNGSSVTLDSAKDGIISNYQGGNISKTQDGKLQYTKATSADTESHPNQGVAYNTLITPRGGQYFVELSDGSKVWLNAASSLRYPVKFSQKERTVELSGEAYFEIAAIHSAPSPGSEGGKIPFTVKLSHRLGEADETQINVLGTHFNVNAYDDELEVKATLLEGAVSVTRGDENITIKPGQQAQISPDKKISVIDGADTEEAVSWKNGITSFKDADIKNIMRKVSRWYNVDVVFEGEIPERTFHGGISRNSNLSDLLGVLKHYKINFELESDNKKLIVKP